MRRARCLVPLLLALAAAGCMQTQPAVYADLAPVPAVAQADLQRLDAGPRAYVVQYRAPATAVPVGGPYVEPYAAVAVAAPVRDTVYTLDSGDKLRVVVFGQEGITGSYMVDAGGHVNLPLIGSVPARGISTQSLSKVIADKLKQGYVRDPHVTVEIETYRPFFILGEVTTPGQYAFVPNMTAETAIAIAGGFAPRAYKTTVEITRKQVRVEVPLDYRVQPGDTIMVKERWF